MKFKKNTKNIYIFASALTVASTVLLTLSFALSFDAINGYFTSSALPILFNVCFTAGILFSLASVLLLPRKEIIKTENSTDDHKLIYIIFAAVLAICSIVVNLFAFSTYLTIAIAGACFFALFILLLITKGGYKYSHLKLLFLLLSTLFPVLINTENSKDMYRHSNSVENMLTSVFVLAFLVYILYEGNRVFSGIHSRWHFASMLLLSHTGLSLSISYIVAYIIGGVYEKTRLYQMVLILIVSAFVEFELIRFVKLSNSHTKEDWDEMETISQQNSEN